MASAKTLPAVVNRILDGLTKIRALTPSYSILLILPSQYRAKLGSSRLKSSTLSPPITI